MAEYQIRGHDKVLDDLKKVARIKILADRAVGTVAALASGELSRATPRMTGTIARQWTAPAKMGFSSYKIENRATTSDNQHSLIEILDKGRGVVRPVRAKKLYIPLTNKGRSKKIGEKPSPQLTYGIDYVYALRSRATKGRTFMPPIIEKTQARLIAEVARYIP